MDIKLLGDSAIVICYDNINYEEDCNLVLEEYYTLKNNKHPGITDIVLCYKSIGIYFDPELISSASIREYITSCLKRAKGKEFENKSAPLVTIPVYYGGDYGPDLLEAADILKMSPDDLIKLHSGKTYKVFGIGFLPGFPYMGYLDQKINLPRKAVPSPNVRSGSVAIAGFQTGIYPVDSPGGWHVIGWTPQKLFQPDKSEPCFIKPGDRVKFIRVN